MERAGTEENKRGTRKRRYRTTNNSGVENAAAATTGPKPVHIVFSCLLCCRSRECRAAVDCTRQRPNSRTRGTCIPTSGHHDRHRFARRRVVVTVAAVVVARIETRRRTSARAFVSSGHDVASRRLKRVNRFLLSLLFAINCFKSCFRSFRKNQTQTYRHHRNLYSVFTF